MAASQAATASEIVVHFAANINDENIDPLIKSLVEIANSGIPKVTLSLSTEGGQITSGIQLYNMLRALPFDLTVHAVGDIASAGNIVFVAGRRRVASPHSRFLFHEPSVGQVQDMDVKALRELAAQLQSNGDRNRAILEERTKMSRSEINNLKRRTSTMTPTQAVEGGLAHSVKDLVIPEGVDTLVVP